MHFTLLVICGPGEDPYDKMLPYQATDLNPDVPRIFLEFVEDEDADVDPETGKRGFWQNPDAEWDWCRIGTPRGSILPATRGLAWYHDGYGDRYRRDTARTGDCRFSRGMPEGWPDWDDTKGARPLPFAVDAVITRDGTWHGVWNTDNLGRHRNREERIHWYETFHARFLDGLAPDAMLYTFDAHI